MSPLFANVLREYRGGQNGVERIINDLTECYSWIGPDVKRKVHQERKEKRRKDYKQGAKDKRFAFTE